jgi:hypothetical protein
MDQRKQNELLKAFYNALPLQDRSDLSKPADRAKRSPVPFRLIYDRPKAPFRKTHSIDIRKIRFHPSRAVDLPNNPGLSRLSSRSFNRQAALASEIGSEQCIEPEPTA